MKSEAPLQSLSGVMRSFPPLCVFLVLTTLGLGVFFFCNSVLLLLRVLRSGVLRPQHWPRQGA